MYSNGFVIRGVECIITSIRLFMDINLFVFNLIIYLFEIKLINK